jgi:hypothetical protein
MKQRSIRRETAPKQENPMKEWMRYEPKPSNTLSRELTRNLLKRLYKKMKYEDRQGGLTINALFQEFHAQLKLETDKRDVEKMKFIVEQLAENRKNKRFRDEFPSFAAFARYLKKENVSLEDLLINEKAE